MMREPVSSSLVKTPRRPLSQIIRVAIFGGESDFDTKFIDVLYSREAKRQLSAVMDNLRFLRNSSNLVPMSSDVTLPDMLLQLEASMTDGLRFGGNTIDIRRRLEQVKLEIESKALYSTELLFAWDEQLPILTQVADFMDARDPREILLLRHMENFFELLSHRGRSGQLFSSYSGGPASAFKGLELALIYNGDLSQRELRRLYGAFHVRERLFKRFTKGRLRSYLRRMKKVGVRSGLDPKKLDELKDELLIELAWFHEG